MEHGKHKGKMMKDKDMEKMHKEKHAGKNKQNKKR